MQVTEINNDLVQVRYNTAEQAFSLGDFFVVSDNNSDILAQIVHLETDETSALCLAKFILNINQDHTTSPYSGYMPSLEAVVSPVSKQEIVDFITPLSGGIKLGKLINSNLDVVLSGTILNSPLYIQSDYLPACAKLTDLIYSANNIENNTILFDLDGTFSQFSGNKYILGENFKLPLNEFFIDFIYKNDLEELTLVQKALVQDILLEIKDYIKTTDKDFLEFSTLINVVDAQYQEQAEDALILFRNKLIEYKQSGYFANSQDEIGAFKNAICDKLCVFSCIKLAKNWQKALIEFVVNSVTLTSQMVIPVTDETINELTINSILNSKYIIPIFISNYSTKYRNLLRSKVANMIFFQAIDELNDFPLYATFLNILFDNSYVIWGEITNSLSIIASYEQNYVENNNIQIEIPMQEPQQGFVQPEIPQMPVDEIDTDNISVPEQQSVEEDVLDELAEDNNLTEEIVEDAVEETNEVSDAENTLDELVEPDDEIQENEDYQSEQQEEIIEENNYQEENELETLTEEPTQPDTLEIVEEQEPQEEVMQDIQEDDLDDLLTDEENQFEEEIIEDTQDEIISEIKDNTEEFIQEDEVIAELQEENYEQVEEVQEYPQEELSEDVENTDETELTEEVQEFVQDEIPDDIEEQQEYYQEEQQEEIYEPVEEPKFQMPVFENSQNIEEEPINNIGFVEGNLVYHEKYGKGIIEKVISYGAKTLCSIQFDNVGRRLLDPNLADLKHV